MPKETKYIFEVLGTHIFLCRMRYDEIGVYPERWDGKKWVIDNDIIAYTGIGGDNPYYVTTEEEAKRFLASPSTYPLWRTVKHEVESGRLWITWRGLCGPGWPVKPVTIPPDHD
ncbi:MAG: hypothetical protein WCG09_05070 [Halobacteriota archaeon]|jgi:hypothetical protein